MADEMESNNQEHPHKAVPVEVACEELEEHARALSDKLRKHRRKLKGLRATALARDLLKDVFAIVEWARSTVTRDPGSDRGDLDSAHPRPVPDSLLGHAPSWELRRVARQLAAVSDDLDESLESRPPSIAYFDLVRLEFWDPFPLRAMRERPIAVVTARVERRAEVVYRRVERFLAVLGLDEELGHHPDPGERPVDPFAEDIERRLITRQKPKKK